MDKKPLPIERCEVFVSKDRQSMLVSLFEYPQGCRWWDVYIKSNHPENLPSSGDLECFIGIPIVADESCSSFPSL